MRHPPLALVCEFFKTKISTRLAPDTKVESIFLVPFMILLSSFSCLEGPKRLHWGASHVNLAALSLLGAKPHSTLSLTCFLDPTFFFCFRGAFGPPLRHLQGCLEMLGTGGGGVRLQFMARSPECEKKGFRVCKINCSSKSFPLPFSLAPIQGSGWWDYIARSRFFFFFFSLLQDYLLPLHLNWTAERHAGAVSRFIESKHSVKI